MQESRARRVVDRLRERGVNASLARTGMDKFGVAVKLTGGREAQWSTEGTAGLGAQVLRDGDLVGFVPKIDGSQDFTEDQMVDAIVRTDYDQPVARLRTQVVYSCAGSLTVSCVPRDRLCTFQPLESQTARSE